MRTFRNNNKRSRFRSNDRNFKRNGENQKFNSDFSSNSNFQRKVPGRNNHNAPKLIEKYNDLAREALSNGDKILSENYFQHADHFTRILAEQEIFKKARYSSNVEENKDLTNSNKTIVETKIEEKEDKITSSKEETTAKVAAVK